MDGNGQYIGAVVENLLGAVPGVIIDIQDGSFAQFRQPVGGDSCVVDVTISGAVGFPGVVAGWAAESEGGRRTKDRGGRTVFCPPASVSAFAPLKAQLAAARAAAYVPATSGADRSLM